jgi:hypothetical protein
MKKLKLGELKVKSFVTSLEDEKAHTVKGGLAETDPKVCPALSDLCDTFEFTCESQKDCGPYSGVYTCNHCLNTEDVCNTYGCDSGAQSPCVP